MKLVYKEMNAYEVLRLFQKGEPITMGELISKGATQRTVYSLVGKAWTIQCGDGKGMNETFQLTEVGYRARGI